jgi:ATP-dependent RNA helicase DeaD
MGYVTPTPVQLAVWEPATRGRDAVVQARTGTGKTASVGLPIIDHVVKRSSDGVQRWCSRQPVARPASLQQMGVSRSTRASSRPIYGGA